MIFGKANCLLIDETHSQCALVPITIFTEEPERSAESKSMLLITNAKCIFSLIVSNGVQIDQKTIENIVDIMRFFFERHAFSEKTSLYVLIELPVGQTIDADTIGLALSAACAEHRESEKDVIIFSGGVSICPSPTTAKMTLGKVKHFNYQLQFAAQKGLRLICPSGPETKPSDFQRYVPICDSEDLFRGTTYMMPPVAFLIHTFAEAILIRSRMAGMSTEPSLAPKAEMSAAPTPPITLVLMPSMQSQPSHGILPFPIEYGYTPLTYTYYYTVSVKPSA